MRPVLRWNTLIGGTKCNISLLLLSLFIIGGCDSHPDSAALTAKVNADADNPFTKAMLGDKLTWLPQGWMLHPSSRGNVLFITKAQEQESYREWIDYNYNINLGESVCEFVANSRPALEPVSTIQKQDFGFACSWDRVLKDAHGNEYRSVSFARRERSSPGQDNGLMVSYGAPAEQFSRRQGRRIAALAFLGVEVDPNQVDVEGNLTKFVNGPVARLAKKGQPTLRAIPGGRVAPADWTLHYDPFARRTLLTSPAGKADASLYLSQLLIIEQRQQIERRGHEQALSDILAAVGFSRLKLPELKESWLSERHQLGFALNGTALYQDTEVRFAAFHDISGALFLLAAPPAQFKALGGNNLLVAMTQKKPEALDYALSADANGIHNGFVRTLADADNDNQRNGWDALHKASRDYDAARSIMRAVGGVNGGNW